MSLSLIILGVEWVLIIWIIIATIQGLRKVEPIHHVKRLNLMRGIWKLEIALGLALCGLAGLGTIAAIHYPSSFGLVILVITLGVFILTFKATKDLEKVPMIAHYSDKIKRWADKVK